MAKKRIISIGFEFPGEDVERAEFYSNRSLMDADIIVVKPYIRESGSLSYPDFSRLQEAIMHWRSELESALRFGKTVFVFLSKLQTWTYPTDFELDNYSLIPADLQRIVSKHGDEIRVGNNLAFLSGYWKEFSKYSHYEVYLEGDFKDVFLTTKTGDKVISTVIYVEKGTIVLLPYLEYDVEEFTEEIDGEECWNDEAIAFGKRLFKQFIEIDKVLHSNRDVTPAPAWVEYPQYRTEEEERLKEKIVKAKAEIEKLKRKERELDSELQKAGSLRRLLYERGTPLEDAILESLQLLGFKAERYKDSESEFDAVFVSLAVCRRTVYTG